MLDTIYTYGNGEYVYAVLNAVASIMGSGYGGMVIKGTAVIGLLYSVMLVIVMGGENIFRIQGQWVAKYIIVTSILLAPTSKLLIRDEISGYARDVENVPAGLALPAVILNNIGAGITQVFDTAFQALSGTNFSTYNKYGLVFGSNLVAESRNLKIQDPVFHLNMFNYSKKCLFRTMGINPAVMKNNNNIWAHMKAKGALLLSVEYIYPDTGERKILNCRKATEEMDKYWEATAKKTVLSRIIGKLSPESTSRDSANKALNAYATKYVKGINDVVSGTTGMSALEILRQQMVLNSMKDVAVSVSVTRALMEQKASWITAGEMARETMPLLRGVLEAIVYSCFLLMLLTVMLPGGWRGFMVYLQILFMLQLWAPLYSVLNFIMQLSGDLSGHTIGVEGFTWGNSSLIVNHHQQIAAIAGFLSTSIPFIAKTIVERSGESFTNIVGNVMTSMSSMASSVATEAVRGNLGMDNISVGNLQHANQTAFQQNTSGSYDFGGTSIRMPDGSWLKGTASGEQLTMSGAGLTHSSGANNLAFNSGVSANLNRALTDSRAEVEGWSNSLSRSEERAESKLASFVESVAQRSSRGENLDYGTSGQSSQSLQDAVNYAKVLHDEYGHSWQQAGKMGVQIAMNPSISGMFKSVGYTPGQVVSKVMDSVGSNLLPSGTISGSFDATNDSKQNASETRDASMQNLYHENLENALRVASSDNFAKSNNLDKNFTTDMQNSYRDVHAAHEALNRSQEKATRYERAMNYAQHVSINSDHSLYHAAQKWMVEHGKATDIHHAQRILDNPLSQEYHTSIREFTEFVVNDNAMLRNARDNHSGMINTGSLERAQNYTFHDSSFKINQDVETKVRTHASEHGVNKDDPKFVDDTDLRFKVESKMQINDVMLESQKAQNETIMHNKQQKVDEYEANRPFKGVVGKTRESEDE
jgi:conjugal transfer mating pair stabilization protein TraG